MAIEVVPYTEDRESAVLEFNRRMREGGSPWGWYEHAEDDWIPPRPGRKIWREHWLALDDGVVRGAYALKPHEWWVNGEPMIVTDWQGPVSEGHLSRRYNTLGLRLLRDMLKRYPRLYSWGHGGEEARMFQMLVSLKWLTIGTPFCLRIVRPFRFLRRNRYLRRSARNRLLLDALAFSGLGWLGLKLAGAAMAARRPSLDGVEVEVVDRFGPWADAIWERSRGDYRVIGLRDAATLNAMMPEGGWPDAVRLRVRRDGADLGWAAVLDHALEDDARFGDLRVGTVIDALARPEDADTIVAAATRFLTERGVDILCSNQSHPRWVAAFARSGYWTLADRRFFVASKELEEAMQPLEETRAGLYLTNLDGHGPHGF